jgi:hypothetical protein
MTNAPELRSKFVTGLDGSPLTLADLPAPGTKRWVAKRKAEVVAAVRGGLLSLEKACDRYQLTVDEFLSWQSSIDEHGLTGLRASSNLDSLRRRAGSEPCKRRRCQVSV